MIEKGYLFAAISMLCNVASQQFSSQCFSRVGVQISQGTPFWSITKSALGDGRFWGAVVFLLFALVAWAAALTQLPISKALPITALVYVCSPLVAFWMYNESISSIHWMGLSLIVIGVGLSVAG